MALVGECRKCGQSRVIDTHCGYCCECLDEHPELGGHKPTCPVAILKAKERAKLIISLHEMIAQKDDLLKRVTQEKHNLICALKAIDACPRCKGLSSFCSYCEGIGYNPITNELRRIAEASDPPRAC